MEQKCHFYQISFFETYNINNLFPINLKIKNILV
jgi:hypothetical protein